MRSIPKGSSDSQIHILEIIGNAIVGGVENYVYNLVQQLPAYGYKVTCLAPYESAYTASLHHLGVEVFVTEMHVNVPWRSIQFTSELIRYQHIDIIHAHLPRAHVLGGLAGRLTGRPATATFHGMEITTEELGISNMTGTHIITVCQAAFSQALALGVPPERVSLIPNGVDIKTFTPGRSGAEWRQKHNIPADCLLVGFAGRVSFEKGPDQFVRMAHHVHERRPDVHFAFVGEGPMEEEVKQLARELKIEEVMHFTGLGKNMWEIYPAFDVQAMTSRVEGMPFALLEGMACGVPSAAMSVGGVAEIVEVGTTGVTSASEDDFGLAMGVLKMLENPTNMKKMGRAARKRVEENFDLYNSLRLTSNLFQSMLKLDSPKAGAIRPNWVLPQEAPQAEQAPIKPQSLEKPADRGQ